MFARCRSGTKGTSYRARLPDITKPLPTQSALHETKQAHPIPHSATEIPLSTCNSISISQDNFMLVSQYTLFLTACANRNNNHGTRGLMKFENYHQPILAESTELLFVKVHGQPI